MDEDLKKKLQRARELITTSRHFSIATVNADGSPHNSPLRFVHDATLEHFYWGSHPDSLHSKNIVRTGKFFAAIYDRKERGGVFFQSDDVHILEGTELEVALAVHNAFRVREGSKVLELSYYTGEGPQKMWGGRISNFWVNGAEKDKDGLVIKDGRQAVTAQDILKA